MKTSPDCVIITKRVLHTPVETVYKAWTDPTHLANWWGPKGFTNTFNEFDLRVGGKWSFIMHGPDKGNYANECEFTQIIPLELIAWKRYSKPLFTILTTFHKLSANSTEVIFNMIFDTPEECNKLRPFVVDKNEENFDKLEDELKRMTTN